MKDLWLATCSYKPWSWTVDDSSWNWQKRNCWNTHRHWFSATPQFQEMSSSKHHVVLENHTAFDPKPADTSCWKWLFGYSWTCSACRPGFQSATATSISMKLCKAAGPGQPCMKVDYSAPNSCQRLPALCGSRLLISPDHTDWAGKKTENCEIRAVGFCKESSAMRLPMFYSR